MSLFNTSLLPPDILSQRNTAGDGEVQMPDSAKFLILCRDFFVAHYIKVVWVCHTLETVTKQ